MNSHPIQTSELIDQILSFNNDDTEMDLFKEFTEKTPLVKKRIALIAGPQDEDQDAGKKKKK